MEDCVYKLKAQLSVLRDVMVTYPTLTIGNIVKQIESRINQIEKDGKENK